MAEKTVTYVIKDSDGKKIDEQALSENFSPHLLAGQTAEVAEPKKAKAPEPASKAT
ncbi:hypothetical protein [Roseomonas xinghualingensis]|uniref:hypothetical protein n=1 Tax=Roseomonas xinghualingensis TaxID=2986475 RepID=UPI0021F0B99F|nr:hypothetical protein [Roseomonas sp. SXEYE001]MCV4209896.1 hypothetical protein [Roseomonas sp. SXEYE001]